MKIREHVPENRIVLAPTAGQQLPFILGLVGSIAFVFVFPSVFAPIAFLILLYDLGELIGHRIIIDKATGLIILRKRYFLLVAKQRVITFEAVVGVDIDVVDRVTPRGPDILNPYEFRLCIYYHGNRGLQTIQIDKDCNEDSMRELAETVRVTIGQKASKTELSLAAHNKDIETNPNHAYAYYARGDFFRQIDEYDLAISDYNKAIQFNPKYARAYHGRGLAYHGKGEVARAVSDLEECLGLLPDSKLIEAAQQALTEIKNSP